MQKQDKIIFLWYETRMKPLSAVEVRFSVAPMMDWTDRHCRYFHRILAPHARLYTEMITSNALIHGHRDRLLAFNTEEHPVAIQLGGSDPQLLAEAAKIAEGYGYDEINLNCGCPSDRVQSGQFGACLMAEPDLVARCVDAMAKNVKIPVTVKCRIGIDDSEDWVFLDNFVQKNRDAGCQHIIIHARKAWLKGLSPKENRDIPPLDYDMAYRVKETYPDLIISVNGGIKTLEDTKAHLERFDGVMIGREAYQNPIFLIELEKALFNNEFSISTDFIIEQLATYADQQNKDFGTPLKSIARHLTGLFNGQKGARYWRRQLAERAFDPEARGGLFIEIYQEMQDRLAA